MMGAATHWRFAIEAHDEPDALIRVLTPFAVQGANLVEVTLGRNPEGLSIHVEAQGLCIVRAETLLRRLRGMAVVRSAALGWRAQAAASTRAS